MPASYSPSSSLSHLINALKQNYPDSRLVAEFLAYQNGQYAVRAIIQNGSTILATGMAADAAIEIAEDRAKARAVAALDLDISPGQSASDPILKADPVIQQHKGDEARDRPIPISATAKGQPLDLPETTNEPQFPSNPLNEPTSGDREEASVDHTSGSSDSTGPGVPRNAPTEPTNLLDQIAKTDVEMQRLGWSNDQGRQLLLERYGKRSRRELTDDEVLDFLHYLEQQP
ncbi:MAG: hypothetical protein F6K30_03155 [Cyanothece sp. SIO2G6]|nr:hypothetical protein [Cyanothece sp. SIO2G6]